jgi:uncharacterized membrane protein
LVDFDFVAVALFMLVVTGAPLVMSIIALVKSSGLRRRIESLEALVRGLTREIEKLNARGVSAPMAKPTAAAKKAVKSEAVEEEPPAPEEKSETAAEPEREPAAAPERKAGFVEWIEEELTSRWLVWLGGLAMAIAGYFLVLYAVEHGLLGPKARVAGGLLLGALLSAAGEYLRRRPLQKAVASVRPDYVPQALTAAGLATMFAAVYAAYGFYGLIGPLLAFVLLAAVALGAFALSVLHGWFVAVLGLLAGFVTPALIPSDAPSAMALFTYLAVIAAACGAVMWYRPWSWLGFGTIAGSLLWTLLWLAEVYQGNDAIVLAGYWIVIHAIHTALAGITNYETSPPLWRQWIPSHRCDWVAWVGALVGVLMVLAIGHVDNFTAPYLFAAGALVLVYCASAVWRPRFDALVILAGIFIICLFAIWVTGASIFGLIAIERGLPLDTPNVLVTEKLARLLNWAAAFGLVWLAGTFWRLPTAERPHVWAAMSAAVPVILVAGLYGGTGDHLSDRQWAVIALGLATALLGCASWLRQKRSSGDRLELSVGIYAIGVIAAISLALVFILHNAWLTVALAVQLPAIAWIIEKLDLPVLRRVALVIAIISIARLAANPFLGEYAVSATLGEHWVLYGYGLPLLAFHAAFVMFRKQADDLLVTVLESGRLLLLALLISGEIRVIVAGSLTAGSVSFLELGLHSSVWLTMAFTRWWAYLRNARSVNWWGAAILTGLGSAAALYNILDGPLLSWVTVGPLPLVNALGAAYLVPAAALGLTLWLARDLLIKWVRWVLSALAFVLGWAWLTFETRHAFQGSRLRPYASDAESYAYSAVWLVAAFAILTAAIYWKRAELRYASLALIVIAVAKVFLVDMADLEGLYRVASFLGLGLSLVAIGYIYQRFVFAGGGGGRDEGEDAAEESKA